MNARIFALGALGVLIAVAAVSAVGPARPHLVSARSPGTSLLHVSGGRSRQQSQSPTASKMDAALAGISRHLGLVRADHALADLHAINPAARFRAAPGGAGPLVSVDAVTRGDPQQLKAALVGLGLEHPAVFANDVGGWLPLANLQAATGLTELHTIRAAMPHTRTGVVTSQGDFVQHSDIVRSANNLTGAGVTVGVLSDSFDCYAVYAEPGSGVPASGAAGYAYNGFSATYADDIASGDLPSNVTVLEEAYGGGSNGCKNYDPTVETPFGDEGRAMLQIVHDVAPGAGLAFYTAENSEADFATGIGQLAKAVAEGGAGAMVIADDVGYFDEPFWQDGIVAQAIDTVEAAGVAYFSAAGNDGTLGYDNNSPTFATLSTSSPNSGEHLLNFDTSGNTTTVSLPVTIPAMMPGEFVAIVLEWDQPYVTGAPSSGGSTNQLDLCITGATGDDDIDNGNLQAASCTGPNSAGGDPVQVMLIDNPASAAGNSTQETLNIQVGLVSGAAPGRIKVVVEDDGLGSTIDSFATNSGTLQGHPGAAGAEAVGAAFFLYTSACGQSPPQLEYFSSRGGDPILFDVDGVRQTAVVRQKPNVAGPDGGYNTFLGFTLASDQITDNSSIVGCQNNVTNANNTANTYPNFFGTSAATPHVASIAALLRQANPSLTPAQIYSALQSTAVTMVSTSGYTNYAGGYGFVQADLAASSVPAVAPLEPTLSLSETSVEVGSSSTLTWTSANDQSCTASGSWTGAQATSGSQTFTPTTVGSDTYSLSCSNTAGSSSIASVTLTVTPLTVPAAPTLTLGANSVVAGSSATITWSSTNATSCTASGSWTGTLATSGTQTLTTTTAGTDTYTLTCANGAGSSPAASTTLTVTAAASGGGGGGGALGLESLLGIAVLSGLRARRSMRQRV